MKRKQLLFGLLAAAAFPVLGLAWLYLVNAKAIRDYRHRPHPRGAVIELETHDAFISVRGHGSPAIVIEAGLGASAEWWPIADALSPHTQTVAYDRAGLGKSSASLGPRDAANIARELSTLLARVGAHPPFILVGESIGALYVQLFARQRPQDVAAIVLVNPITTSHERFSRELPRAVYQNLMNYTPRLEAGRVLASLGLVRALGALPYRRGAGHDTAALLDFYSTGSSYQTWLEEYSRQLKQSIHQVMRAGPFSARPLRVIHHNPERFVDELMSFQLSFDEAWDIENLCHALSHEAATLSPEGRLVTAEYATRYLHVEEPELMISILLELLQSSRAAAGL